MRYDYEDNEICAVTAREVIDSRGNPTVEVEVETEDGFGRAIVPSGASTGSFEALELRDGGTRFAGKGVRKAVSNVNEVLAERLLGFDVTDQRLIDDELRDADGTDDKSNLGANAIVGVSMACAACAADACDMELYRYLGGPQAHVLPVPMSNVLNAGLHGSSELELQEFMVMPTGVESFSEALQSICEVYHELKKIVADRYGATATGVGDEGGYSPPMKRVDEPLEMLVEVMEETGYDDRMGISIDAAASEFYDEESGTYRLEGKTLAPGELIERYYEMIDAYPIVSLEDPFAEHDYDSFATLTGKVGRKVQIVGDDLFVTNPSRIETGLQAKAANALLLKLNQIGTVTEAWDAAQLALRSKWGVVVSHRSGETEDTFIADLAVALNCAQIKTGAPCRSERTAKYNRLLRIEEDLGDGAVYDGARFRAPHLH